MKVFCKDCQCWNREEKELVSEMVDGKPEPVGYIAECHRYPPQVVLRKSGEVESYFPMPLDMDYCYDGIVLLSTVSEEVIEEAG